MESVQTLLKDFNSHSQQSPTSDETKKLLQKLKLSLIDLNVPSLAQIQKGNNEAILYRDVLESFILYSLRNGDEKSFERYYAQIKPFYFDYDSFLSKSTQKEAIIGAYFLFLLAENRIGEFHTELELIHDEVDNQYIQYAIQLEQSKMEGSYNKIVNSSASVPVDYYEQFIKKFINTSRHDIADALEKSCGSLELEEARKRLLFNETNSFEEFIKDRKWRMEKNKIHFGNQEKESVKLDSVSLLAQNLAYANELERII